MESHDHKNDNDYTDDNTDTDDDWNDFLPDQTWYPNDASVESSTTGSELSFVILPSSRGSIESFCSTIRGSTTMTNNSW